MITFFAFLLSCEFVDRIVFKFYYKYYRFYYHWCSASTLLLLVKVCTKLSTLERVSEREREREATLTGKLVVT